MSSGSVSTGGDLRTLTLAELKERLLEIGVSADVINSKSRWEQVKMLQELLQQKQGTTSSETPN